MASYRVYYCDARGKVFSANDFEATDDAGAIDRAVTLVGGKVQIFEVWQRDCLIHRHPKSDRSIAGDKPPRLGRSRDEPAIH